MYKKHGMNESKLMVTIDLEMFVFFYVFLCNFGNEIGRPTLTRAEYYNTPEGDLQFARLK